jgi:hypothetical protein
MKNHVRARFHSENIVFVVHGFWIGRDERAGDGSGRLGIVFINAG